MNLKHLAVPALLLPPLPPCRRKKVELNGFESADVAKSEKAFDACKAKQTVTLAGGATAALHSAVRRY
ncbi:hypothetical protein [Pantoea septica]|uniref:hypothetical protein n=1 Tax=Pantoea septica TaxID=472695 RepID=UPI00289D996D|nr:hypothetical protein [Pantoea septica]